MLSCPPAASCPITGPAARAAAKVQLQLPEYRREGPGPVQRLLTWLGDRWDSLDRAAPGGSATILFALLLICLVVFALVRAGRPGRTARARAEGQLLDHAALAERFTAQGQFAQALREWLRASVRIVELRGVLEPRPGRTAADLARQAGAAMPSLAADLQQVTQAFDAVWFGDRAATIEDVQLARQLTHSLRRAPILMPTGVHDLAAPR